MPDLEPQPALFNSIPTPVDSHGPFLRRRMENLIESVLGLDPGDVHATARLRDDFGVDFLDLLELALAMEAELDVQIPDRALKDVTTVDDLIRVASRALAPTRGIVSDLLNPDTRTQGSLLGRASIR